MRGDGGSIARTGRAAGSAPGNNRPEDGQERLKRDQASSTKTSPDDGDGRTIPRRVPRRGIDVLPPSVSGLSA